MTNELTDVEINRIKKIKEINEALCAMKEKLQLIDHFQFSVFASDPNFLSIDVGHSKFKISVVVSGVELRRFLNNTKQGYIIEISEMTKELRKLIS